jgi:ABC-type molybdenum transport system ATPase subunit/photorepair protein PhrA
VTDLSSISRTLSMAEGRRAQLQQDLQSLDTELKQKQQEFETYDAARLVGTWISDTTREDVRTVFASIGSSALQAIFGGDSSFDILYNETKSGKRQAQLAFTVDGVSGDVLRKGGNSAGAVLSTMLRRAMILLDPRLANLLIADEPLYGIDATRVSTMAALDRALVDENGMQLIIITHDGEDDYRELADVVIEVSKVDGVSQAKITQREEESL